jgi:hypothetical protein
MQQNEKDAALETLLDGLCAHAEGLREQGDNATADAIDVTARMLLELHTGAVLSDSIIGLQEHLIKKAVKDRDHWKANHDNQVARARVLMDRPDMPLERVEAYQRCLELEAALESAQVVCDSYAAENQRLSDEIAALKKEAANHA